MNFALSNHVLMIPRRNMVLLLLVIAMFASALNVFACMPVGGYTFPIKGYTTAMHLAPYLALVGILTAVFITIKRKTHKRLGRRKRNMIFTFMLLLLLLRFSVLFGISERADITITDFYSCDSLGNPQDYFPKKTTAYFNISVRNLAHDPKNISIYLTVQDELDVPIGSDQLYTTILPDVSAHYIMSIFIPKWACVGIATGYVSVLVEGTFVDSESTNFYIGREDLTPPVICLLSPENVTYETEPVPLVFAVNERTSWMGYSLNSLENVTLAGNTTLTSLPNGSYSIIVYANDTSGNVGSSEEVCFTILIVHDVAIIDLKCSPAEVYVGQIVNNTVFVKNEGTVTEIFNVTTYYDNTAIGTKTITNLAPNTQTTLTFSWNTTDVPPCTYTIKAVADTVPGETDTTDNTYTDGTVRIVKPPVAAFTCSPTTPLTGQTVTFDASPSTPDGGTIISYEWNFGDGANATGMITTHMYTDNGTYTVTLTVTDDDGLTDTDSQNITVLNRPPIALFTESATTVPTGTIITFNASASYDLDGTIVNYFWDFGDGTNASDVIVTHSYADNGTYKVTLTITDDDGTTASTNATKTILNRPPVAIFIESAETVYTDETINFNASASYDSDGVIFSYFWDFGDGTNATGVLVNRAYTGNGTYTVALTVTDNDGTSTSTKATKTVLNRPDIAVTNVTLSKTVVGQGYNVSISVTVENQGDYTETFDVTIYANMIAVETQEITLASGNSTTTTFAWNTSGFAIGTYAISAYVEPVLGETDIVDNRFVDGIVKVFLLEGPYYTWYGVEYWIVEIGKHPIRLVSNY